MGAGREAARGRGRQRGCWRADEAEVGRKERDKWEEERTNRGRDKSRETFQRNMTKVIRQARGNNVLTARC